MHKETITFNDREYTRYPSSKRRHLRVYFQRMSGKLGNRRPQYLHRDVWISANGPIPDGFHVHHKDNDPSNNDIANLAIASPQEHQSEHAKERWNNPDFRAKMLPKLDENREATKAWHRSPEGRAWHAQHAKKCYENRVAETYPCKQCGKPYTTIARRHGYCSNNCKSAARRASGVDNVSRECPFCKQMFIINRYARAKTCSAACGSALRFTKELPDLRPSGR